MTKTNIKLLTRKVSYGFIAAVMLLPYLAGVAAAAPITARSVVIGSSAASASTTYDFAFTAATASTIKSVKFQACDNASGACTQSGAASGFSSSAGPATLAQAPTGLGGAGVWSIDTTDATSLRIKNTTNSGNPGTAVVKFAGVRNPSATNSTFYIRLSTYTADDWSGTAVDTGVIATSTAGQVTVSVAIDESLTFTLASTAVVLTQPTTTSTGTGTSAMTVSTNAATGYTIGYSGTTLTSGVKTIDAMATQAVSATNTKQFGLNLRLNTTATSTPAIGADKTGLGTGTPATGYQTADQFKFNTAGDVVATASIPTNTNTFTTSYIVNMDGSTAAGVYSTILTYTATANF